MTLINSSERYVAVGNEVADSIVSLDMDIVGVHRLCPSQRTR